MSRLKNVLFVSLFVAGLVLVSSSPAGAVPYTGVGPNSSIIGWATQGADYTTLIEAARVINQKATLTGGDWIFYINNDLTSADIVIGATTFNNRIIFKPMPGKTPTITFTQAGTTPVVLARIGIGINTSAVALASLVNQNFPQTKVTIDGSNVDGGNTRDLTIQTNNNTGNTKHMIRVFPGGDDVIIKNVRIIQTATATTGNCITSSVATTGNALVPGMSPDNGLVENCFLSHPNITATANAAIASDRISGTTVACTGWVYRANDVRAGLRGFSLLASRGFRIEDNIIRVSATGTGALLTDAGIHCGMIAATNIGAATYAISGNIINCTKTISTLGEQHGIRIDDLNTGPNTVTIVNNAISIVNTQSAATQNPAWVTGIRIVKANTIASIHHNSIHVRSGSTYTAAANGQRACLNIPAGFTLGTASVLNNIFRINITSGYCVAYQMPVVNQGVVTSDYNMFFPVGALNLGRDNAADRLNLAAWTTNTPWDDNSSEGVDPSGVPGWNTLSDLRLSANPVNAGWFANPIAGITKDIDGNTRGLVTVTKGCDENATAFSPTPTPTPAAPTPTSTPPIWIPGACAQGLFDGTGPGTSTIGACGDYENLGAAFDAINAIGTLTGGDWTFIIQNDLVESRDIVVAATTVWPLLSQSNKIIVKPKAGLSPLIRFINPSDMQNGSNLTTHLTIGTNTNAVALASMTTDNQRPCIIEIDGQDVPGGTTRMTFRSAKGSNVLALRRTLGVIANADNFVVRNSSFTTGMLITALSAGRTPDNGIIDNCAFSQVNLDTSTAGTAPDIASGWLIKDSTYLSAPSGAVRLYSLANFTNFTFLRCNLIYTSNDGNSNNAFWWNGANNVGTWDSCKITCTNAGSGGSSGSTFIVAFQNGIGINLYNNFITAIGSSGGSNNMGGVQIVRLDDAVLGGGNVPAINVVAYNNSCIMRTTTDTGQTGTARYGIIMVEGGTWNGSVTWKNNVVLNSWSTIGTNVLAAPLIFYAFTGTGTLISDDNLIFNDTTADADNRWGIWQGVTTYTTRALWSAASSQDVNSDDTTNPLTGLPGTAKWVSNSDFHFSPEPGLGDTDWHASAIGAPVLLDYDGGTRGAVTTTRGAIEASTFLDVDSWALY